MSSRSIVWIISAGAAVVLAHMLDWWALEHLAMPRLSESDLGRMLRVLGFVPLWLCIAIGLVLTEEPARRWRDRARRGGSIVVAAAVGGLVAELMKIIIRRERPDASAGVYAFREWGDQTLHTGGLGLPSSHALVAFAALAMLSYHFPRARGLWIALGIGCALTRVASGAHFLSDVVVSAVLGYAIAGLLWKSWASTPVVGTTAGDAT